MLDFITEYVIMMHYGIMGFFFFFIPVIVKAHKTTSPGDMRAQKDANASESLSRTC